MSDYLVKSLAFDGQIRAYAVDATETVSKAQQLHDTWSAASAALGRSLIGTLLLSSASLQGDEKMTVKINGNGPVGGIVVDGNANGTVKGYVQHPHIHLPLNDKNKIDVRGAVGTDGFLAVTKDLGLKEPFTGQVPLVSGELGEDFTYYLAKSEQIPSSVGLSVFVNNDNTIKTAGGFMLQVMPGAKDEVLDQVEKRLNEIPMVSEMMNAGKKPEDILNEILGAENVKILDKMDVSYYCDCSRERFWNVLKTLPVDQLKEMADEDHGAEAVCHFCGKKYHFSEKELNDIITKKQAKKDKK
ncbi:MAG TPA: Hsp33 family molecular chaperone HslO [Candidatus Ligilactobacillus excrementigallinarum]|uniref:33 kDa chaperonin n=1 Tax=Candidatus Ligilactobacillus excrementigallinarum TaxID=2838641 RepID=A0A9D1UXF0_9LACO|nr:Hsp33 family molecular chaperone HslO [Candidatus Ligilactobacillus excrementigallinarum]